MDISILYRYDSDMISILWIYLWIYPSIVSRYYMVFSHSFVVRCPWSFAWVRGPWYCRQRSGRDPPDFCRNLPEFSRIFQNLENSGKNLENSKPYCFNHILNFPEFFENFPDSGKFWKISGKNKMIFFWKNWMPQLVQPSHATTRH